MTALSPRSFMLPMHAPDLPFVHTDLRGGLLLCDQSLLGLFSATNRSRFFCVIWSWVGFHLSSLPASRGHFHFAQIGHYHFAPTAGLIWLTFEMFGCKLEPQKRNLDLNLCRH
jgi:hypothetical protein